MFQHANSPFDITSHQYGFSSPSSQLFSISIQVGTTLFAWWIIFLMLLSELALSPLHALSRQSTTLIFIYKVICWIVICRVISTGWTSKSFRPLPSRGSFLGNIGGGTLLCFVIVRTFEFALAGLSWASTLITRVWLFAEGNAARRGPSAQRFMLRRMGSSGVPV